MSTKADVSFESLVSEALERMKNAAAASVSYEVDRTSGRWVVRRASTTGTLFAADVVADATGRPIG